MSVTVIRVAGRDPIVSRHKVAPFVPDATGLIGERSSFNTEAPPFAFLATDEGLVYFRKNTAGQWSDGILFPGPAGDDGEDGSDGVPGAVWRSGSGAPVGGTGIVGDLWLNTANGDLHQKTGAITYTLIDNLTGPTGPQGPAGEGGAGAVTSVDGETGVVVLTDNYSSLSHASRHQPGGADAMAVDAAAATGSLRTIGTSATSAAAGNDSRLSDQRTPTDSSVTNAKVDAAAAIAESKLNLASDAAAGTASRRTLGTGATQAVAGNDSRLSDARTPVSHNHAAGDINSGTMATTRLGSGTASSSTFLRGDQTYATPQQYENAVFFKSGTLTAGAGVGRFPVPVAATIVEVRATVNTAPTGSAITLDVNKNGTTIYTTQGNRPQIAVSTFASSASTNMDVTSLAVGDYLTVDVDVIGSTIAGSDLVVSVRYRY